MQKDTRFIRTLRLRNLLSFGPDSTPIELSPLNVLIGPNGSGKSNVIEAINLLRASATDLIAPIRAGGGTEEWLWKGIDPRPVARVDTTIRPIKSNRPLHHSFSFGSVGQRFELVDESIVDESDEESEELSDNIYYSHNKGKPLFGFSPRRGFLSPRGRMERAPRALAEKLTSDQSVLSQLRDPSQYPEITYLSDQYGKFTFFRDWNLGRSSNLRRPQPVDQPNSFLAEDASNLGLVLSYLDLMGEARKAIYEQLTRFYDQFERYSFLLQGGTVQVFFHEKNLQRPVPAARLSDGTLRFLCLATILCHPTPPPLICLEEPEIGLHPDILPIIAELLIEASRRTQVIVTTHSDILVDTLSQSPEAVLVCEKETNTTLLRRLNQDELREWLKEYSLGDLWRSGELGGNRW